MHTAITVILDKTGKMIVRIELEDSVILFTQLFVLVLAGLIKTYCRNVHCLTSVQLPPEGGQNRVIQLFP
jgi:hypothetical protein